MSRWRRLLIFLIPALTVTLHLRFASQHWNEAKGYEYEWVALPLASGHGYSFESAGAWLGPYTSTSGYSPTAWVEPIQTMIIALAFYIFGEQGRFLLVLLNVLWIGMTAAIIYLLTERIVGSAVGLVVAVLFALLPFYRPELVLYIGNSALAVFLLSLCTLLIITCLEKVSTLRCLALAMVLGIAILAHAALMVFIPLAVILILTRFGARRVDVWKSSAIVPVIALLIITPWALRNTVTFGNVIPVRNGLGYQVYVGNLGLARTFDPVLQSDSTMLAPPWTTSNARQAVASLQNLDQGHALLGPAVKAVELNAPEEYQSYNEAQRDNVFLSHTVAFALERPLVIVRLALWKGVAFYGNWGPLFSMIAVAAFVGWFLMRRDLRVTGLMLLLVAYTIPYAISIPFYYRYRFPVEPILFVLAGVFLGVIIRGVGRWLQENDQMRISQPF
jgi:4-amino-4-deoxy-L-arabinose transferase-like glycosyltransferase